MLPLLRRIQVPAEVDEFDRLASQLIQMMVRRRVSFTHFVGSSGITYPGIEPLATLGGATVRSLEMAEQWDLIFTLPNLAVPNPTPLAAGNTTSRQRLNRFTTAGGEAYRPGCFLIRSDFPIRDRNPESIRAFRNVCAVSTTTAAYAGGLHSPRAAQWRTH